MLLHRGMLFLSKSIDEDGGKGNLPIGGLPWYVRMATVATSPPVVVNAHLYGHGKVENLAALAETLLLLVTCGCSSV